MALLRSRVARAEFLSITSTAGGRTTYISLDNTPGTQGLDGGGGTGISRWEGDGQGHCARVGRYGGGGGHGEEVGGWTGARARRGGRATTTTTTTTAADSTEEDSVGADAE